MNYVGYLILSNGVGYCFIHAKAMREAVLQDKADIVPTPIFYTLSSGNLRGTIIKYYDYGKIRNRRFKDYNPCNDSHFKSDNGSSKGK